MGFLVKLDTNGYHPGMLAYILERGLADYVAMDIKNAPDKYAATCGLSSMDLSPIRESVQLLMNGSCAYEFRTTVVEQLHEPEDFHAIGNFIKGADRYFLQCFTDRDTVPFAGLSAPSTEKMKACRDIAAAYVGEASVRGVE